MKTFKHNKDFGEVSSYYTKCRECGVNLTTTTIYVYNRVYELDRNIKQIYLCRDCFYKYYDSDRYSYHDR